MSDFSAQCILWLHDKPSLLSSHYLGRNGCQAGLKDNIKKQKTISQISCGWDNNILWTLTLDCGPLSFYSSIASHWNNISHSLAGVTVWL